MKNEIPIEEYDEAVHGPRDQKRVMGVRFDIQEWLNSVPADDVERRQVELAAIDRIVGALASLDDKRYGISDSKVQRVLRAAISHHYECNTTESEQRKVDYLFGAKR